MGHYGGTTTVIKSLPVGTKFYVHNGAWNGEIISRDGVKCVLIEGEKVENAREIKDERTLDISIEGACKHKKVYADYTLTSNPPKYPWICSKCGDTGADQEIIRKAPSYEDLIKHFGIK